jgi:hypothetical protein
MAKRTYVAKRNPETGRWNIFDDKGNHETRTGTVNVDRNTARRDAFLLNSGRLVIAKRGMAEPPVARFVPTDPVAPHMGERDFVA